MITEAELATTKIALSYTISPVKNIICDLSGILGNFNAELIGAFYPRLVSKRANIVITELVNNVLENIALSESPITLEVSLDGAWMDIRVRNVATPEQYAHVKQRVDLINNTEDLRQVLKETIRQRRQDRLKGGIGLMRLVVENKFRLATDYNEAESILTVHSQLDLGGLA